MISSYTQRLALVFAIQLFEQTDVFWKSDSEPVDSSSMMSTALRAQLVSPSCNADLYSEALGPKVCRTDLASRLNNENQAKAEMYL
jgi:hypothetical protein